MSTLTRLVELTAPFRWWVLLAVLLSFSALAAGIALMAVAAYLISKAALVTGFSAVALAVAGVRGFAIARAILRYAERYISHLTTFRILTRLRVWLYTAIEPLAPAGLREYRSGDLLSRIAADIETLDGFYIRVVVPPLGAALAIALAATIVSAFDLRLALVLVAFLLVASALPLVASWTSRAATATLAATRAELTAALTDQIQGMPEATAFGQTEPLHRKTLALSNDLERVQQRLAFARGMNGALVGLTAGAAGLAVLLLAIPMVVNGSLDGIYLALLPLTAFASFEAVQQIASASEQVDSNRSAARRLFELMDAQGEVRDSQEPFPTTTDLTIEFRNVSFRYAESEPDVLKGVRFKIPSCGRLAITGPSGSGKTTIVNLLLRFWDCQQGEILIGGRNIARYRADDVRDLIGVVPQHVYLFNGTVRDNLLLGRGDASEGELFEACRRAQLHDFISNLPHGYDTLVGENGHKLSGGERQRLAIARVILKNAPVLILDEATAGLDREMEQDVLHALNDFMAGRTVLIISHDAAGLELADEILALD